MGGSLDILDKLVIQSNNKISEAVLVALVKLLRRVYSGIASIILTLVCREDRRRGAGVVIVGRRCATRG